MNEVFSQPASILCIGNGWFPKTPSGLDRYVYELAHALAAGEDQVELWGLGLPEILPLSSVKLRNLAEPDSPLWQRLWSIRHQFLSTKTVQPDAINCHFALNSFPLLPNLPAGVPVTFTFHGPWALESKREGSSKLGVLAKHWLERLVYRRCDRFIVLSQAFGTLLHQEYKVPWHKIHIIPGGVDTRRFQPDLPRQLARAQLNWPQERAILFTPRRLVQRMGLDTLLKAIALVAHEIPEVWLAIAGRGPLRDSLEQQVQALGLSEQVQLLGYLPDDQLPIAYQAADLTVVPSQSLEGFGLILLESLACGTPVLCTPIGGMPEVLRPLCPQLITESAQETAIAIRLKDLLRGDLSLPSRAACRDYAVAHFDWQAIAQQVKQVLLA
jgi:glycosyltransferase involved in cell wall biosynthesis